MIKEVVYNNRKYWINIKSAVHKISHEKGFVAYVSEQKDNWDDRTGVRDGQGELLFFGDQHTAFVNARAILESSR